jgi:hypothetical protein
MELLTKIHEGITYTEEWKPIEGYEGMYEVSSFGRVKSLDRVVKEQGGKVKLLKGRLLAFHLSNQGYYALNLCKEGLLEKFTVHKIVSIAFLNHKPNKFSCVIDHLNSTKTDNFYKNLKETSSRHNSTRYKKSNFDNTLGVQPRNDKYFSCISVNGKTINLGTFDTKEDASLYYKNAVKAIENGEEIKHNRKEQYSKFKGISFLKRVQKWVSEYYDKKTKKRKIIGRFKTEEEAYKAREEYIQTITNKQ